MILLDTDMFSLYVAGHPRVAERVRHAEDDLAITIISRIEVLQGRFEAVVKAAGGNQLQRAHQRLGRSEHDLAAVSIIPIDAATAAEFDRLRQHKKLKKIGRADVLIACIALAHHARLVTRNLRHF